MLRITHFKGTVWEFTHQSGNIILEQEKNPIQAEEEKTNEI